MDLCRTIFKREERGVYTDMKKWEEIRHKVLREGVSKRQIMRDEKIHRKTLEKILGNSTPPGYRMKKPRKRPKIGPFEDRIREILKEDKNPKIPKKQRHTAKKIFERLRNEGYTGGATQVKEAVRRIRQTQAEPFMPLTHRPGEAQVDFGYALVKDRNPSAPLFEFSPKSKNH